MGVLLLIGLLGSCLVFGPGLLAGFVARQKGYRPWPWLLSMGPIGLLLVLLGKGLDQAKTPEEREQWESRSDWTGGILSGFTMFFVLLLPLSVMLLAFSWRSASIGPAPRVVAPLPAQSVEMEAADPE